MKPSLFITHIAVKDNDWRPEKRTEMSPAGLNLTATLDLSSSGDLSRYWDGVDGPIDKQAIIFGIMSGEIELRID